jgi:hypothetical protein
MRAAQARVTEDEFAMAQDEFAQIIEFLAAADPNLYGFSRSERAYSSRSVFVRRSSLTRFLRV